MIRNGNVIVRSLGLGALLVAAGQSHAQCNFQNLFGSDRSAHDYEGVSVALSGPYAFSGASGQNNFGGVDSGKVYCFHDFHGTWTQHSTLTPVAGLPNDHFGASVAAADPYAIVGAPGVAGQAGAAYIMSRTGSNWQQQLMFVPNGTVAGDQLGARVAMNEAGDLAVAGAAYHTVSDAGGTTAASGTVYVLSRSVGLWFYDAALAPSIAYRSASDHYGAAVSASGNAIIVGAPGGNNGALADCGFAQILRRTGPGAWNTELTFFAPDRAAGDAAGSSVAIDGDTAIIGAPNADLGVATNAGAIYVVRYVNGVWQFDAKITCSDVAAGALFGSKVSVKGDQIVAAAYGLHKLYMFHRIADHQWVQDMFIADPAGPHYYAGDLAFDGFDILTGDYGDLSYGVPEGGVAYVYPIAVQQPSDTPAGATPITPGTYSGCTIGATVDLDSACSVGSTDGPDVWYQFTATKTGTVTLSTQGSQLDTVMTVHTGLPGGLGLTIACNDDFAPPLLYSRVSIPVTPGQVRYVRIAGYGGSVGSFTLAFTETCSADYDGNGLIEPADVAAFVNAWYTSLQNNTLVGDWDKNLAVEPADVAAFINAWYGALNGAC